MVCIFFVVEHHFLIHQCSNNDAEKYSIFLNYPQSHYNVWQKLYEQKYAVDFDFYPRGRVVYNTKEKCYYIYHDKCITNLDPIIALLGNNKYKILLDFHYQCSNCQPHYL